MIRQFCDNCDKETTQLNKTSQRNFVTADLCNNCDSALKLAIQSIETLAETKKDKAYATYLKREDESETNHEHHFRVAYYDIVDTERHPIKMCSTCHVKELELTK